MQLNRTLTKLYMDRYNRHYSRTEDATKSAQHACRKKRDHSEFESLSPVGIGVPDEQLFVIRSNQEQLAYDLLIRFQHAQTARSETNNTRTRRRVQEPLHTTNPAADYMKIELYPKLVIFGSTYFSCLKSIYMI